MRFFGSTPVHYRATFPLRFGYLRSRCYAHAHLHHTFAVVGYFTCHHTHTFVALHTFTLHVRFTVSFCVTTVLWFTLFPRGSWLFTPRFAYTAHTCRLRLVLRFTIPLPPFALGYTHAPLRTRSHGSAVACGCYCLLPTAFAASPHAFPWITFWLLPLHGWLRGLRFCSLPWLVLRLLRSFTHTRSSAGSCGYVHLRLWLVTARFTCTVGLPHTRLLPSAVYRLFCLLRYTYYPSRSRLPFCVRAFTLRLG